MMRRLVTVCAVPCFVVAVAVPAVAQTTTVEAIIVGSEQFDGMQISVEGELVGDYGHRSDGSSWSQLDGGTYATEPLLEGGERTGLNSGIGVRIPTQLMEGLDPPGGYRARGPLVVLTGIWHHHDPARGGESYLDVIALEIVEPGRALHQPIVWWPFIAGLLLLGTALAIRRSVSR
jgi:hypothetical protein